MSFNLGISRLTAPPRVLNSSIPPGVPPKQLKSASNFFPFSLKSYQGFHSYTSFLALDYRYIVFSFTLLPKKIIPQIILLHLTKKNYVIP